MFGLSSIEFFNWIVGQVELFTENIKLTAAYHNYMHVISPCKCSWWQVIYCINSWLTWTYLWECEHFVNAYPCSSSKTISSSLNSKFHFGLCISLSLVLCLQLNALRSNRAFNCPSHGIHLIEMTPISGTRHRKWTHHRSVFAQSGYIFIFHHQVKVRCK